ncbi:hypothetical protein DFH08DRAFT_917665 [Mycena albidolilacea]|uniref:CxC2-like cysteine cluster KDZ transposase-associated domain-containing protein n=1 Tax=Mycena albidolilacea TaxID=1033008 RepID=A0AAD6ZD56_9AGAR|nr:hypothetical protein DFH08DRAFT_917665 [Mycena albidolilacea]
MLTWAEHQDEYLDEMLRLEGRGYASIYSTCGQCGKPNPRFRCAQQTCLGLALYCQACVVARHAVLPTHWIQEWNGNFFERRSLKELNLVVQLGHPPGSGCQNPVKATKNFVVIDVTGIHYVDLNFCDCDSRIERRQQLMRACLWPATARDPQTCATFAVVRLFQILNCQGKVSAHDFLRSLELLTNNDGRSPVPGELALRCRACPQPGRNLPEGYKYFLFIAQDCNFRLINRNVGSVGKDPILNDGCGYFVNHEKYTEFLSAHVSEAEISSCSGFQAMFLANRKRVKGLRTTGVGGVTCARHNMWRPNGIGDLQLGERYSNMDFILRSALLNFIIFYLILSYDIACQYGKNFWSRMKEMPEWMTFLVETARVWFKVPNFHLPPHQPACHSPFSFHYMWGAGRTHGETVEQNWEFTNGAAASTKMMGLGTRASTLEDLFGFHNWRRTVAWRRLFPKRMAENIKEGQVHRDAFEAFDSALREAAPEMVVGWEKWVHEWESRQHKDGTESPFELREKVMTMQEIRRKLAKDELLRSGEGDEVEREETPSTFLLMGMEIEESQRYLAIDVKAVANPTDAQAIDFLKRRTALVKRIRAFRKLQRTYMPNLRRFLTAAQRSLWDTEPERNAEAIRLFMPSEIADKNRRVRACAVGLPAVEEELRVGEVREALHALRQGLRTRTMTNRFRLRHCTGQRMLTRGQGVLRQVNLKIHKAKLRYRYARNALTRLKGHGTWETELQVLEDKDGGVASFGVVALGESRRTLSWIWYQTRPEDPTEAELVEALRVEWCKAYARMRRWHEDVVLVEEEMRRTIEYGYWSAADWVTRAGARGGMVEEELREGLAAYAAEQVDRETKTSEGLAAKWARIRERGRAYLARETAAGADVVIPLADEDEAEGEGDNDEEEGPPDYADEGDDEILE